MIYSLVEVGGALEHNKTKLMTTKTKMKRTMANLAKVLDIRYI